MKQKYECYFPACGKTTRKIGQTEADEGWIKFQGRMGIGRKLVSLTVVCCPDHRGGFKEAVAHRLKKIEVADTN